MNIGGYGSRIALAEPVIGRAFARPVGSLVRDDEIDSIFKQPILRPSLRAKQSIAPRKGRMDCFVALLLADVEFQVRLRVPAARDARVLLEPFAPLRTEGAGKAGW